MWGDTFLKGTVHQKCFKPGFLSSEYTEKNNVLWRPDSQFEKYNGQRFMSWIKRFVFLTVFWLNSKWCDTKITQIGDRKLVGKANTNNNTLSIKRTHFLQGFPFILPRKVCQRSCKIHRMHLQPCQEWFTEWHIHCDLIMKLCKRSRNVSIYHLHPGAS